MSRSILTKLLVAAAFAISACTTTPKSGRTTSQESATRPFMYPTELPVEYLSKRLDAAEVRKVWNVFCDGRSARRNITVNFDYVLPAPSSGSAARAASEMTRLKKMLPLTVKRFFSTKMKSGNPYLGLITNPKDLKQLIRASARGRMELDETDRPYTPFADHVKFMTVDGSNRILVFWSNIDHRMMPILETDGATYFEKLSGYGTRESGVFDEHGRPAAKKYEDVVGPFDFLSVSMKQLEIKKSYYPAHDEFEDVRGTVWPVSRTVFAPMALLMDNFTMLIPVVLQEKWGWRHFDRTSDPGFYINDRGELDPKLVQIKQDLFRWDSSKESVAGNAQGDLLWSAYVDRFTEIQSSPSSELNTYSVQAILNLAPFCLYGVSYESLSAK